MYNSYPEEVIEEVRISNDIVDVVSEYVKLERKGKDYFGLCPFHKEKTPSFSVVPAKQIFYCFGCGKGGNVINFVMNVENLSFIDAVRLLADRARIQLPEGGDEEELERAKLRKEIIKINTDAARFFFNNLGNNEKAVSYLKNRGINERTIKRFGLGYSGEEWDSLLKYLVSKGYKESDILKSGLILQSKKGGFYDRFRGRIMFPIFDLRGNVIGFGGRVTDSSLPKYMNSPETLVYNKGRNLYSLNFAKNSGEKRIIIVEGYMDVISLHQSGIINTVASLGTALTESQGRLLKKYAEEVVISYDSDTAGQAATMRGLDLLSNIGCNVKVLLLPQGKDPDEYIRKNGVDGFRKLVDNAVSLIEYKIKILKNQIDTSTTEGKISFLNKAASLLSKIDNSVELEMYVKKIAKDYGISEESLFAEISKKTKAKNGFRKVVVNSGVFENRPVKEGSNKKDDKLVHDEQFVLALMCLDNSLYKLVKDRLTVDDFTDENNIKVAKIVFEKLESNKGIVSAELFNLLDETTANVFSRLINEECHCDDNKSAIMEKIRSIKLYKIERRQKEILDILKNDKSLDEGDVERLKIELNSLVMKRKSI